MNLADEKKWTLLHSKVQQEKIARVFAIFRAKQIEPILIKGFSVERFYPEDISRLSFDIDLSVSSTDYDSALTLLHSQELKGINIDIHRELRHLDTLSWRYYLENSKLILLNNKNIRVLCDEDLLRVMCVHWLTDGGENKDKLWDIYYLVKNRSEQFNWNKCFHDRLPTNRKKWIIYTIGLAHKHLDLNLEGFPFNKEASKLPDWLDKCIRQIWDRKHPFIPLDSCFSDRKMFFYQLRQRLKPNPIMSTIGLEGDFDTKAIYLYQLKYFFMRAIPSLSSILKNIKYSLFNKNEQ